MKGLTQPTQAANELQLVAERRLTAAEFQGLAKVPAAAEWFANLDNPRTRRAYQSDIADVCNCTSARSSYAEPEAPHT